MNEIYYFLEESKFEDEDEIIRDVFGICAKDSEGNTRATYPDLFFEGREPLILLICATKLNSKSAICLM